MAIDLDAIIAEQTKNPHITKIKLRGKVWRFTPVKDLPSFLWTEDVNNQSEWLQRLAVALSNIVDPKQREDFSKLELTVREAEGLWREIVADQQGLTPGESEASPASS